MEVRNAILKVTGIHISANARPAVHTCAEELKKLNKAGIKIVKDKKIKKVKGMFYIGTADDFEINGFRNKESHYICKNIDENGNGFLIASHAYHLYSSFCKFIESAEPVDEFRDGKISIPAFEWNRISYDYFIAQEGRIVRNLDKENYIRQAAKNGFTHMDINGLGFPMGLSNGPKGEVYPMFYTYCAALDQFVYSKLNKGLYPYYYLSINLANLIENAKLAVKYGIVPGFTSFEPRDVPEDFFARYPTLRGARVDHPFRSYRPRFNMTITHPLVLEHYAEMVKKILHHIPELGFISIWSNDSGAGFEYTCSLYVGRNGGAYLIREWKDHKDIAEQAGNNIIRFLRTLRDAASTVNPDFRIMTRLESFYGEHDFVWNGLGDRIDIETNSLIPKGWKSHYSHAKYADSKEVVPGSIHLQSFDPGEITKFKDLEKRNAWAHYYYGAGPRMLFEPLLGIPYPELAYRRLNMLHSSGVRRLAHINGTCSPDHVPYNINHEISSAFQNNPGMNFEKTLEGFALKWAGKRLFKKLVSAWKLVNEAVLSFPNVSGQFSTFGFTWHRLWARPFVPNLLSIPPEERAYYEDFMCTIPNNPNNADLSRDVLFYLTTPEKSEVAMRRIDSNVLPLIKKAVSILEPLLKSAELEMGINNVIYDQYIRMKALHCWVVTNRNVAAWVSTVYGYMDAKNKNEKNKHRKKLRDSILLEIENSINISALWNSGIEFMEVASKGETPLVYGDNIPELMEKRISLMKKHIDDEPFIDHDFMRKQTGKCIEMMD